MSDEFGSRPRARRYEAQPLPYWCPANAKPGPLSSEARSPTSGNTEPHQSMALIADQVADLPESRERPKGIEPSPSVWKTEALPLSYGRVGRAPRARPGQGYRLAPPAHASAAHPGSARGCPKIEGHYARLNNPSASPNMTFDLDQGGARRTQAGGRMFVLDRGIHSDRALRQHRRHWACRSERGAPVRPVPASVADEP
jgi:hypothetical protein